MALLDSQATYFSDFSIGMGTNADSGGFLFDFANAAWNNFIVLTTDSAYPYKTQLFYKAITSSWYWLCYNVANSQGTVGYASTIPIGAKQPIYADAQSWLTGAVQGVSPYADGALLGYGIPTEKTNPSNIYDFSINSKRVFWCNNGWKLRAAPDALCMLSSDNKIASCPTTVSNKFLCIP